MITQIKQADTVLRAAEQAGSYTFRRMTVKTSAGPVSVVYVYGGSETYQITEGGHHDRCSCPHYRKRLAGTTWPCKHILLKKAHDEAEARAAAAVQANRETVRRRQFVNDWGCED